MRWICAFLLLGAAALAAAPARAQIPASEAWSTLESTHFRVTYTRDLEPIARHAAAAAERARAALLDYIAEPPRGRIDIVLSDNVDVTNGGATPFPANRIFLYAKPPVELEGLQYVGDWMELVVAHELAHIFHLDVTSGFGRAVRRVFGRIPFDWPLFPAIGTPDWATEGLAVVVESALTTTGRLNGTWHDLVVRTAALEDTIDDIDRLSSESPLWPGGQRVYIYGSLFLEHLEQRYGPETLRNIVAATAAAGVPPLLWFDRVGQRSLGVPFRQAYDEWRHQATAGYRALADTLRAQGLTSTRTLATHGGVSDAPRFSPDGRSILYTAITRRSTPELRVIDAGTGDVRWRRRTSGSGGMDWLPDGSVLGTVIDYTDPEHLFYDLYRHSEGTSERLQRGARLEHPDVTRDGSRIVAVQNYGGTNRLVLLSAGGAVHRALTAFDPHVHWSTPRWSPDGNRIAVGRWTTGGRFDVVVLDAAGALLREVTDGVGINSHPTWSPDARYVVFSSDRTGIPNLYAYDLETGTLHQVTNVLTGAFAPDVSPDGSSIIFSAYHADGFHLETIPFDPASFRAPQPARLPQLPLPAPARARFHADTLAGAAAPYHAWQSARPYFWLPLITTEAGSTFVGAATYGWDLVGRHAWGISAAVAPGDGRTAGSAYYNFGGLPPIGSFKPEVGLSVSRAWDRIDEGELSSDPYIDERESVLSAFTALQHLGWKQSFGVTFAGEFAKRHRELHNAPGMRLFDPRDDLAGLRLITTFANARQYPFSISAEDGVRVQLSGRKWWDRSRSSAVVGEILREFDAGYRELTAWSAGYRSLGRVKFANAVAAVRASALIREGPGAATHGVGGSSGGGLPELDVIGSDYEFLPVRGFRSNARRGTHAWSASAELRLPLALIAHKPRPLPFFLHSLAGAAFVDAGDASCPQRTCRLLGPTLISAGAELGLDAAILGLRTTIRAGAGVPLQGAADHRPRGYFALGRAF